MDIGNIIFALVFVCMIAYFIAGYIRRSKKSKNYKYIQGKYPNGFLIDGVPYTFMFDENPDLKLPVLEDIDLEIFHSSDFHNGIITDCSFSSGDSFGGDCDGGGFDGGDCGD